MMPYRLIQDAEYPGTKLPVWHVYDAELYDKPGPCPRPIGEVWATGTMGVCQTWMPTGLRWQLAGTGMLDASEETPYWGPSSVAKAAKAMIAAYEADRIMTGS
jgi:hypothetical protein